MHTGRNAAVGVLGPIEARDAAVEPVPLRGTRHRIILARLAVARGRVVPRETLIDTLWERPPAQAEHAIRTFVSELRRAVEPGRKGKGAHRLLVSEGAGYAWRGDTDADRFARLAADAADAGPGRAIELADEGLDLWRGPAYGEFAAEPWALAEAGRLTELRHALIERRAGALLALGRPGDAVPGLRAHAGDQPWRQDAHRLLALALYRAGRQAEALDVIRGFRKRLAGELGLDAGSRLDDLETGILRRAPQLDGPETGPAGSSAVGGDVLAAAVAASQRPGGALARTRVESAAALAGSLALGGGEGLREAMRLRLAAIEAAGNLGDPEHTARVIANFAVPAIWTRSDDPELAARVIAVAARALTGLPREAETLRARLLATIALESRGTTDPRARDAAGQAETIARRLGDPALLAFTLAGTWMQSFWRTGLSRTRGTLGTELIGLASRHGLTDFEILGRLVNLQALSARGDFDDASDQASHLDRMARVYERPGVTVFTTWYRAMRAVAEGADASGDGYARASSVLDGCGMPGVACGLPPLARLCLRVGRSDPDPGGGFDDGTDWGPYRPWARPWLLLAAGQRDGAGRALQACPAPPPGVLAEALWCLTARAAVVLEARPAARAAREALLPAADEIAGASSGMLTAGPVRDYLGEVDRMETRGP